MSTKDPYSEGAEAFQAGKQITDNPYDPVESPMAYERWENGYWMASVNDASKTAEPEEA